MARFPGGPQKTPPFPLRGAATRSQNVSCLSSKHLLLQRALPLLSGSHHTPLPEFSRSHKRFPSFFPHFFFLLKDTMCATRTRVERGVYTKMLLRTASHLARLCVSERPRELVYGLARVLGPG
ncbi:hypothetical protein MTO96_049431 [Rhipicephalus appendiculatus]